MDGATQENTVTLFGIFKMQMPNVLSSLPRKETTSNKNTTQCFRILLGYCGYFFGFAIDKAMRS